MTDGRIAYGATCSWWDSIDKVASRDGTSTGLPCCPHCRGVLMEVPTEAEWWAGARQHEAKDAGYVAFLEWLRGKCFTRSDSKSALEVAREVYTLERAVADDAGTGPTAEELAAYEEHELHDELVDGCVHCGTFVRKTLVIRLPVLLDPSKLNDNYGPEFVLVETLRMAVDSVPYLSAETLGELDTRLAVRLEDRS